MARARPSEIFNLLHPYHFATAVSEGDMAAVSKVLALAPGLINQPIAGYNGATALMLAAFEKQEKMTSYLLLQGADATLKDNEGLTSLDYARFEDRDKPCNPQIVEMLVSAVKDRQKQEARLSLEKETASSARQFQNHSTFQKPPEMHARKMIF